MKIVNRDREARTSSAADFVNCGSVFRSRLSSWIITLKLLLIQVTPSMRKNKNWSGENEKSPNLVKGSELEKFAQS
jgi:hypothetical protein